MKWLNYFVSLIIAFIINNSFAVNEIEISSGVLDPMPIALTELKSVNYELEYLSGKIHEVVRNDLKSTGLFKIINKDAFLEDIQDVNITPNFVSWNQIGAVALSAGNLSFNNESGFTIDYKLWDVFRQKVIDQNSIVFAKEETWRIAAHKLADKIYTRLTGDKGYFNSRISFVAEEGPADQRRKRIAIMDQDGHNVKYLTDGKYLVLTPKFSPDGKKIVYLSYAGTIPRVYLMDLASKKEIVVGDFPGMSYAPNFSPDGKQIVLSATNNGNSSIYLVDLASMHKKRITFSRSIDTSPYFSPDGEQIVYVSDIGGTPQLYVMNKDGSNARRISFGEGRYAAPSWSPRGDLIAFTKIIPGKGFYIGVMRPNGSGERTITDGYLVESQSWSPNGRVLVYARSEPTYELRVEKYSLYTIDITGYNDVMLSTPTDASDPNWSVAFY